MVIKILSLKNCDCSLIIEWNKAKTANFLQQWAGRCYEFPLTKNQILSRIDNQSISDFKLYKIILDNEVIGTIESMNIAENTMTANTWSFSLKSFFRWKRHGTIALNEFVEKIFKEFSFIKLGLIVFDFNKSAFRCYEKAGFKVSSKETRPNGWIAIKMEIDNPAL